MKHGTILRRLAALILAAALCGTAAAEEWEETEAEAGDWPALNEAGFLDSGEFIYENPEEGVWRYCSQTLKIEVIRRTETDPVKLRYYDAEVWSREEVFSFVTNKPGKHFTDAEWPSALCSKNGAVLAINADYASHRVSMLHSKKNRKRVGILVREGKIISEYTQKSNTGLPNLDTMAIYPDGKLEVYDSDELTAEEYLAKGAADVLSFGPWLIRDGALNSKLPKYESKFNKYRAPRTSLGMIEPGHYIAIMAEGRLKESKGCTLTHLAELMQERSCVNAINMDGGETACILFMGKQICDVAATNKKGMARKETEFLAIGTSELVEGYLPPEER